MTTQTPSLPEAEVIIKIQFYEVDLMEVAWHGHYVNYLEIARCALLDTISYNYREMKESGYAWPIIELKMRYAQPARLGQKIKVKAFVTEYELRLKIDYLITDVETGKRLTKAYTVQAAVDLATQELLLSSPPIMLEKLGIDTCD